jgi:hypothetical protein
MRKSIQILALLAIAAAGVSLGGCFHHHEKAVVTEPLPPSTPPLK